MELSKARIESIKEDLESKDSIFLEKRYLESLSLPGLLIGREAETRQILEFFCSKTDYLIPFLTIVGSSGSGKTAVTKQICDSLLEEVDYSFVNLRKSRTIFGCSNLIIEALGGKEVKASEGINKVLSKIEMRIMEMLQITNKKRFVLVLDEFDVIFSDARSDPSDFVFKLLTIVENLRSKDLWLCIVAISNLDPSSYELDERVLSRMDNHQVIFAPYKEEEIFAILEDRAKKAFQIPISDEVLKKCASISASENGDCRKALQILLHAGEKSQNKSMTVENIEKISKELNEIKCPQIIKTATSHQKLLLAAIAKQILYTNKEGQSTSDIYGSYRDLMPNNLDPLSYRRAFDLLRGLENTGIIVSQTSSKGRYGYKKYYVLTEHFDLIGHIISPDWWENLKHEKGISDAIIQENIKKYKLMKKLNKL